MTTAMQRFVAGIIVVLLIAVTFPVQAQERMSREQWQDAMTRTRSEIDNLRSQLDQLNNEKQTMQTRSTALDAEIRSCEDALYALVGVTREEVEAFERELADMERRVEELQRMSDAELMRHRDEIERMDRRLSEMTQSPVTKIPRYANRVRTLQDRVAALLKSVTREGTYTVGTWSRDRDCLWNIAKKSTVYSNAWLWPKIWQGNRDKIRDPDIIQPRWVLRIPEGRELTPEERSAANRYYRRKASASAPVSQ